MGGGVCGPSPDGVDGAIVEVLFKVKLRRRH